MRLFLVGISHRTATVEIRERVDFQTRGLQAALGAVRAAGIAREAVVLSTCNRSEIYGVTDDLAAVRSATAQFLSDYHGISRAELDPHIYSLTDTDVARHLFRVSAGLDSLVVGEPQIQGQVKDAHHAASAAHASGTMLNRLFHSSLAVGKRVRTETALGAGAVSISFAAVSLARKIFGDLKGRNVLVVGAGEMGKLTALHMKKQGVQQVAIVSRTMASAARTAEAIGGASAAPWDELPTQLGIADIVISATGAAAPILTKGQLEAVMRPRRNRPLFIIDIAMPRDVEAAAGELEQVFLYNIDDLQATVQENLARRAAEVQRAEAIVDDEVGKFAFWMRSRSAVPIVVALRQRFDAVRRAELDRLTVGMPPETRERVDDITRLLVEKLLLTPTEQLKAAGDADVVSNLADALTRLFNLSTTDAQESGSRADASSRSERKVEPFVRPHKR